MKITDKKIAHIVQVNSPHLLNRIVPELLRIFGDSQIYLWDSVSDKNLLRQNLPKHDKWIKNVRSQHVILLSQPLIKYVKFKSTRLIALLRIFVPEFSIAGWFHILTGPRYFVQHGYRFGFATMLLLRMFGKKITLIHWGGPPWDCRGKLGIFARIAFRLYEKIFVLMPPEIQYFVPIVGPKVSHLSYPSSQNSVEQMCLKKGRYDGVKIALLGCNAWNMDGYREILDKMKQNGGWDKIVCMLNYGNESRTGEIDNFVKHYKDIFGEAFVAWQGIVPFEEYVETIKQASVYICPAKYQSGLGAIFNSLEQGKAVFIRGDNYTWLHDLGVDVYDIDQCSSFSATRLTSAIPNDEIYMERIGIVADFFMNKNTEDQWKRSVICSLGLNPAEM